jgi:hypothetical protein
LALSGDYGPKRRQARGKNSRPLYPLPYELLDIWHLQRFFSRKKLKVNQKDGAEMTTSRKGEVGGIQGLAVFGLALKD